MPGHSVLSALLLPVVANAADAQTYTCQSANSDHALALKNDVIALVTGTDTRAVAARDTLKLLPASASQVSIVTHTETCATAGRAYHAAMRPGTPEIARSIVLIRIANDRYVIKDPAERLGEFGMVMITAADFKLLKFWTS